MNIVFKILVLEAPSKDALPNRRTAIPIWTVLIIGNLYNIVKNVRRVFKFLFELVDKMKIKNLINKKA